MDVSVVRNESARIDICFWNVTSSNRCGSCGLSPSAGTASFAASGSAGEVSVAAARFRK